jgi:hypothetical protein
MRTLRYLFLMICAAALAPRAGAQPAVGCDTAYLSGFTVIEEGRTVWEPGEIECVEHFRFTVATPRGPRVFRGIGDINARALLERGAIAQIEAGARRTAQSLAALGDYKIKNVTYLISLIDSVSMANQVYDLASGRARGGATGGWARTPAPGAPEECPITLFPFEGFGPNVMNHIIAHETFHCVQNDSLSSAQFATAPTGGAWWAEGSAELFAAHTFRSSVDRGQEFRASVEAQRSLVEMDYDAAIFFYWYNQRNGGLGSLMPLLRRMAGSPAVPAQRAALRAALPNDALLQFAKDFDDNRINYPNGPAINFGPKIEGERWTVARNSTLDRTLKPFVIMPGWTDYECGKWANTMTPRDVNAAVRDERRPNWQAWPNETDCRTERRLRYRVMAMHTGDANARMSLRVERRIACDSCLPKGDNHIDACLVGTWELTGGGPMEWMARRMGRANFKDKNSSKMKVIMLDNGMFRVESQFVAFETQIRSRSRTEKFETAGQSMVSEGFWSAKDGKMRACSVGVAAQGTTTGTVTTPRGTTTKDAPASFRTGPTEGDSTYVCSPTTYTSSIRMSDGSNMDFVFTRLSPPPPPPAP